MSLMCERITDDSRTNALRPRESSEGSAMIRGSIRGARTTATAVERPNASVPPSSTTKFRLLFATFGNGCDGSMPMGVSSGLTCLKK